MTDRERPAPIEAYLAGLAAALPPGRAARDLLDEAREHLHEARAAGEAAGLARADAEREAVREFGGLAELAPQFRAAAVVGDAHRQARRQLLGALLLAVCFPAILHLLPGLAAGIVSSAHRLTAAHAALGAALGSSLVLLGLSRLPRPWRDPQWLTRLDHASQTPDPAALRAGWRERAARIGAPAGLALAEAFTILDLD